MAIQALATIVSQVAHLVVEYEINYPVVKWTFSNEDYRRDISFKVTHWGVRTLTYDVLEWAHAFTELDALEDFEEGTAKIEDEINERERLLRDINFLERALKDHRETSCSALREAEATIDRLHRELCEYRVVPEVGLLQKYMRALDRIKYLENQLQDKDVA